MGEAAWVNRIHLGSAEHMDAIPDGSVHTCVTSPPYYGLRDYGIDGQIGLEPTIAEYVERLVAVFREVRRVLRDDGTAWLNLGDSYATTGTRGGNIGVRFDEHRPGYRKAPPGLKQKDLIGIPGRVAFALQADGWWLRDAIVWAKPNPMPSSVGDRCTPSYEMVFMLAKSARYYADMDAVRLPLSDTSLARFQQAKALADEQAGSARANGGAKTNGAMKAVYRHDDASLTGQDSANRVWDDPAALERIAAAGANLRNVWTIATTPYTGAHFATMPRALAERCILIGAPPGGVVLDPFMGSGTVAEVALGNGRQFVGYELNPEYHRLSSERLGLFAVASGVRETEGTP